MGLWSCFQIWVWRVARSERESLAESVGCALELVYSLLLHVDQLVSGFICCRSLTVSTAFWGRCSFPRGFVCFWRFHAPICHCFKIGGNGISRSRLGLLNSPVPPSWSGRQMCWIGKRLRLMMSWSVTPTTFVIHLSWMFSPRKRLSSSLSRGWGHAQLFPAHHARLSHPPCCHWWSLAREQKAQSYWWHHLSSFHWQAENTFLAGSSHNPQWCTAFYTRMAGPQYSSLWENNEYCLHFGTRAPPGYRLFRCSRARPTEISRRCGHHPQRQPGHQRWTLHPNTDRWPSSPSRKSKNEACCCNHATACFFPYHRVCCCHCRSNNLCPDESNTVGTCKDDEESHQVQAQSQEKHSTLEPEGTMMTSNSPPPTSKCLSF